MGISCINQVFVDYEVAKDAASKMSDKLIIEEGYIPKQYHNPCKNPYCKNT
jgi:hypothetical protein